MSDNVIELKIYCDEINDDKSIQNIECLYDAMSPEGRKDIGLGDAWTERMNVTNLGVVCELTNDEGQDFNIIVMDTSDLNVLRRRILSAADGIAKNFPELVKKVA